MSLAAVNWTLGLRNLKPNDKLVLLVLAEHADSDGAAFPGVELLSAETCLSRRSVVASIGRLRRTGLLEKQSRYRGEGSQGGRTSNIYRLQTGAKHDPPQAGKAQPGSQLSAGCALNRLSANPAGLSANPAGLSARGAPHESPDESPGESPAKNAPAAQARPTPADASEEKRLRKVATKIPADFRPEGASIAWIESLGVTIEQAEPAIIDFREYWAGRTKRYADWQAAFRRNPVVESSLLRIAKSAKAPASKASSWQGQPQQERTASYHHVLTAEELAAL